MDEKSENATRDISRSDTGTPTGALASPAHTQQVNQSEVPPELRPTQATYSSSGEPTRQWSAPPPQAQAPPLQGQNYSAPQPLAQGRDERYRRPPIVGPLLLITAGVIFLLNNLEVLPWSIWNQLWRLWPLILVLIGLEILLGRRSPMLSLLLIVVALGLGIAFVYSNGGFRDAGNVELSALNVPLGGAKKANVQIEMGAGELNIDSGDTSQSQLATGELGYFANYGIPRQSVNTEGDTVRLTISQRDGNTNIWPFFGPHKDDLRWDVHLNRDILMNLGINGGAGNGDLDLEKLKVTDLNFDGGVGNFTLTLPASGATTADIDGGVGNLDLVVPEGVAARLKVNTGIGNVDVDSDFTKQGDDTYLLNWASDAKNRLDLSLNAGIGNVSVQSK